MSRFADGNKEPAINITTWFLLVTAVLSVVFRLGTKYHTFRKLTNDDHLIIISLVFSVSQSIAVSMAVANGYGQHLPDITRMKIEQVMKAQYAASLLYIMSMYFSKMSMSKFIRNLTPVAKDHLLAVVLQIGITIWMVVSVFGTAFQCEIPRPWDYLDGQCIKLVYWHYFVSAMNIATDISIIIQALLLVIRIQASMKKKMIFAGIFMARACVIIAIAVEIILTQQVVHSADPMFDNFAITIAVQTVQCTSIVTACWGQLKPFLNQFKSTGLRIQGVEYQTSAKALEFRYGTDVTGSGGEHPLVPIPSGQGNTTTISASRPWDAGSQSSQACIIRETRTWVVTDDQTSECS